MTNALEIRNLNKNYGEFQLKNVSFTVPKGSIVGFIGENGAGKTTTLKAILNLVARDSGTIEMMGMDIIKEEKKIKENIGVVFDGCNFHDNLNTGDISKMMGCIYKNWNPVIYNKYLGKFKLPENKKFKEFSRGMKMKLQIGVALSHEPTFLILDEATSGLDPIVREEIRVMRRSFSMEILAIIGVVFLIALVFGSVMLPLIYKFGTEKARLMLILCALIPMGIVLLLSQMKVPIPTIGNPWIYLVLLIGFTLVGLILSYGVSLRIYKMKEF